MIESIGMVTRRLLLASLLGVGAILAGCPGSSNSSGSPIKADTPCPPGEFIRSVSVSYPSAVLLDEGELRLGDDQYVAPVSVCRPQDGGHRGCVENWIHENFITYWAVTNLGLGEREEQYVGGRAGFLPLKLSGTLDLLATLEMPSRQVPSVSISIDDEPAIQADSKTLLTGDSSAAMNVEGYEMTIGPTGSVPRFDVLDEFGLPKCFKMEGILVPLRITMDAARIPYGLHHLDVRWSFEKEEPQVRRLYFARILDAAGVLWKSESVLWVGTARQGVFELNLGNDLKSELDDTLTPVPFSEWLNEVDTIGLGKIPSALDFPVELGAYWPGSRVLGLTYEYSGLLDLTEVNPSLLAHGGLGSGIQFADTMGQKVPFEFLGEGNLPDQDVSGIAVDKKGYLWASTFDLGTAQDPGVDGISVFRPDFSAKTLTWLANFAKPEGLKSDNLIDIFADPQNVIWIPSDVGIHLLDYGVDPEDKTDDKIKFDERFLNAYQIEFTSEREVLIAHDGLSYLDFAGTAQDPSDDTTISYPQLQDWAASFNRNSAGLVAVSSCSRRKEMCYAFFRPFVGGYNGGDLQKDSAVGVLFKTLPCPGVSFLRFGPDIRSSDDDEVWRLYDAGGVGCGGTVLPPPENDPAD